MKNQADFVKQTAIKASMKASGFRSTADAMNYIEKSLNELIGVILTESGRLAKKDRKKTIFPKHVSTALEKHIGKSELNWDEILPQVLQETPADLGKLSKGIRKYIETHNEQ
jgi:histone H3/H4